MKIPLIALIVQGIPEQIAVVTLAFILADIPINWKKIVPMGILLAVTAYLIRLFPTTFGIHTIIIIGLLFMLLILFCKDSIITSLKAALLSVLILIIVETSCVNLLISLFSIDIKEFLENVTTRILISLPQVFVLFLISFLITKFRAGKENAKGGIV